VSHASFLADIPKYASMSLSPSNEGIYPLIADALNSRIVTQFISDTVFMIKRERFHFIDVSGLKEHRKSWIPYFDGVTTILFIVALSSYNQAMVEDPTVNRMMDALTVFESIVNNPLLQTPSIILFYNKKDLYTKKVKHIHISEFFPEYQGNQNLTAARDGSVSNGIEFFKMKFEKQIHTKRDFYSHVVHNTIANTRRAVQIRK
jgi:hypothetical protein